MKTLLAICGPNGSGKSTAYKALLAQQQLTATPWINADELLVRMGSEASITLASFGLRTTTASDFNLEVEDHNLTRQIIARGGALTIIARGDPARIEWSGEVSDYEAAIVAEVLRRRLLHEGISFAFETVMSHESKVKLLERAKGLGYDCQLIFVCTDHVEINVARVAHRVRHGGHDVPVDKIRARYLRAIELLPQAVTACTAATLIDSTVTDQPRVVAQLVGGEWTLRPPVPDWATVTIPKDVQDPTRLSS